MLCNRNTAILKLSLIIPTYNEEGHIGQAIRHLKEYGKEGILETIVVDGGSTDGTRELAESEGATVLVASQTSRPVQMNLGAEKSRGDVLYFVHADTRPPRTFVSEIRRAYESGCQIGNFPFVFDSSHPMLKINGWFTKFHWMFCQGGDKTLFVCRDLFFELGGYDAEHVVMEEYDFLRRALKAGYSFEVLEGKVLVSARKYENNSWLRVQLANMIVFNLWSYGLYPPQKLKTLYRKFLR